MHPEFVKIRFILKNMKCHMRLLNAAFTTGFHKKRTNDLTVNAKLHVCYRRMIYCVFHMLCDYVVFRVRR